MLESVLIHPLLKKKGGRKMKTKTFVLKFLKLIAIILLLSTLLVLAVKK